MTIKREMLEFKETDDHPSSYFLFDPKDFEAAGQIGIIYM